MKKIFFASDFHLGLDAGNTSREREKEVIRWLDHVSGEASEIFLLGDVFDFWFEYRTVVPRGHARLLAKLGELSDAGIKIHWFTGNHDMWIFDYIPNEFGITLHRKPIEREILGKRFLIGHGDGLGPGDPAYKLLKKIFASRLCQFLFGLIHPDAGIRIARFWSKSSRHGKKEEQFKGENQEWLMLYAKEYLKKKKVDYFVFGHRHLPLDRPLEGGSRYINLGDWLSFPAHYAVFDGELRMERWK